MSERTKTANGTDHGYDRVMSIMTEAVQSVERNEISLQEFVPALVDFTAAVALAVAGEAGLRAFIKRMRSRIGDYRAGTFPVDDTPGRSKGGFEINL